MPPGGVLAALLQSDGADGAVWGPTLTTGPNPPANPRPGDIWVLPVVGTGAGLSWTFRYSPATSPALPWEFVGGAPLVASVAAQEPFATGAWSDPTTPGPIVTVPRRGDYSWTSSAHMELTGAAFGGSRSGTTVAVDAAASGVETMFTQAHAPPHGSAVADQGLCLNVPSGKKLTLRYFTGGTGSAPTVGQRTLSVLPVRVAQVNSLVDDPARPRPGQRPEAGA